MALPDVGIFRIAALPGSIAAQLLPKEPKEVRLFIANRGEIALRILNTVASTTFPHHRIIPLVPHNPAEAHSAPVLAVPASQRIPLPHQGPRAFLDIPSLIAAAKSANAHAVIPGYGFLSESAEFAQAVLDAGLIWVGPDPAHLRTLGNKLAARQLASKLGIPVVPATANSQDSPLVLEELERFARDLPNRSKIILKTVAGGGGRGMRVIDVETQNAQEVQHVFESCAREASAAFGDGALFAELLVENARHIEVQVVGDGSGAVAHLWERECTLQRRHQKLVEWAPSPTLRPTSDLRNHILEAALRLAGNVRYKNLGTFEFLVLPDTDEFFFMEANPRLQVEHTVTEQVTGLDLVALQLRIALLGASLADLHLGPTAPPLPFPSHFAVQLRINAEQILPSGEVVPSSGSLSSLFSPPTGRNIRVDTAAHAPRPGGITYTSQPAFDSLLAKLIVTGPADWVATLHSARVALESFGIEGIVTNREFLLALLDQKDVRENEIHTRYVDLNLAAILASVPLPQPPKRGQRASVPSPSLPPANLSSSLPSPPTTPSAESPSLPAGLEAILAPLVSTVVSIDVKKGDSVQKGQQLAVLSAMKMENVIRAPRSGTLEAVLVQSGDSLERGRVIFHLNPTPSGDADEEEAKSMKAERDEGASKVVDLEAERPEVTRLQAAKALTTNNAGRKAAVEKRHQQGFLTARENVELLADQDSFVELGDFVVAAQRSEVDLDQLKAATPGDGVLIGFATVNEHKLNAEGAPQRFPSPARVALCIGDYLTQAGTQGWFHHLKLDRIFNLVLQNPAPLILYAEGGGGRPNDIDLMNVKNASLDTPSFTLLSTIKVRGYPTIGVGHQYVFAGNTALLGTCDVIIATGGSSIGMGGPAMIEGGGLGKVAAKLVGPAEMHAERGHIDILVQNEREAADMVKRVLLYFQGALPLPSAPSQPRCTADQRLLRHILPESRTRTYDVRRIIHTLADDGSFTELGARWRTSLITGFIHVEGQPVAVIASDVSTSMGGAIDVPAAQKTIRFLQMLQRTRAAHVLVLCDTPGFAIGPEEEVRGGLRVFADLFGAYAAYREGPDGGGRIFGIVVRKGYGLAAEAILGGSSVTPFFSAAWPTAEMAGMNIEGAVALGMRKQLALVKDEQERKEMFYGIVAEMYERGRAESMASKLEVDTVIDPADTRKWLLAGLRSVPGRVPTWQSAMGARAARL
ncbi:unnamed protein product [Tilletia controversa]|uniref:Acetyl-CoA carboxylase n=1 Tax=Tilletia controversa TaxID=13291 RepID=A0A8X7MK41_9BASI|nr:hypothetical protein CF328_g7682 [Tilletia controversa]KAE8239295.1 hypothetical protein A4X06_0g8373 [Tilletia controversa]CAD6923691.1 unnamed protein product [Tilletia controversa]